MPPITPLRTLDRTAATFKDDCDIFFGIEMHNFSVEAEAMRLEVLAKEASVAEKEPLVAANAVLAQNMAEIAVALANFKGAWPSLSGPLPKPASALHNSAYWVLLNDLANVATSEPGVSADWTEAGVTSVNGMRGAVVIESSVADSLYLNNLAGAF